MGLARRNERQIDRQYRHLRDRYLENHSGRWLEPFARLERQLLPLGSG